MCSMQIPVLVKETSRRLTIQEEWRSVPSYPNYEVNNMGEVREAGAKFPMPWWWDERGYRRCAIWNGDNKPKQVPVHKLVADAFLPSQPTPKHTVNHIDGVKDNNWAHNLEWATIREQNEHARRLGLWTSEKTRGVDNGQARLTKNPISRKSALCKARCGTPTSPPSTAFQRRWFNTSILGRHGGMSYELFAA